MSANMKNRIKAALAGLLMAIGITVVVAEPAYATWACANPATVCFATNINGGGNWYPTAGTPIGQCHGVISGFNDVISSVRNNYTSSGGQLTVYENNPCGGVHRTYPPNWIQSNVGSVMNDRISAFCIGPHPGTCP